jgi:hypothetical protein
MILSGGLLAHVFDRGNNLAARIAIDHEIAGLLKR